MTEIEPIVQETISANRMGLLNKQKKKTIKKAVPKVLVTKFNPCIKGLRIRRMIYWDNIQHDEICKKTLLITPPMVACSNH